MERIHYLHRVAAAPREFFRDPIEDEGEALLMGAPKVTRIALRSLTRYAGTTAESRRAE